VPSGRAPIPIDHPIRSVANVTSQDVQEFIALVAQIDLRTDYELLDLDDANDGLRRIESGDVRGSFVLTPRAMRD